MKTTKTTKTTAKTHARSHESHDISTEPKETTVKTQKNEIATPSETQSPRAALAALVKELSATLDQAERDLGPQPATTTSGAKRRTPKPRRGSERVLSLLVPIVEQHGLNSPSLNTKAMMDLNDVAQALLPLQVRLQKLSKRVNDQVFGAQTSAWTMGLQFYSLLQRRAKADGVLAQTIEPLTQVFAYRSASAKEGKPTKLQTRARARLEKAKALAAKHGVTLTPDPATSSPPPTAQPTAPQAPPPAKVITVAPVPTTDPSPPTANGSASNGATSANVIAPAVLNGVGH